VHLGTRPTTDNMHSAYESFRRIFNEVLTLTHCVHVRHDKPLALGNPLEHDRTMATEKRMLGIHLTEQEHTTVKALAEHEGESIAVLFRRWLRSQAKKLKA
jgi:hypothetical protein